MRVGSLFSGAGGLDLAVEQVFGGRTVWHCEQDAAASAVLAYRWPGVPNLGDITAVDWSAVEPVDVLCGGFPCQDVSSAGRRAGLAAGTRSGLWSHYAAAIDALRPRFVVIENVRGLLTADGEAWPPAVVAANEEVQHLGRVVRLIDYKTQRAIRRGYWSGEYQRRKRAEAYRLARRRDRAVARFGALKRRLVQRAIGTVVADLASLGYDAQWTTVSAASVGAPHRRERVFILATADADRAGGEALGGRPWSGDSGRPQSLECGEPNRRPASDAARDGRDEGRPESTGFVGGSDAAVGGHGPVDLLPTPSVADSTGGHATRSGARSEELLLPGVARAYDRGDLLPTPTARDHKGRANAPGRVRDGRLRTTGDDTLPDAVHDLLPTPEAKNAHAGPDYARMQREGSGGHDLVTAIAYHDVGQSRWGKYAPAIERWEALTRPAPSPTEPNTKGNPRLAAAFAEWMQGWPHGWCTDPAIGISRNDQLRIVGNGVCPQQAIAAQVQLLSVCGVAA